MSDETLLFIEYRKTLNQEIFERLYQLTKPWLLRLLYKLLVNRDLTEEIFQETWIQIITNMEKFDENRGKFNNFVYTIAKNKALKLISDSKRFVSNADFKNDEIKIYGYNDLSPELISEIKETNLFLNELIQKLDENYRDVILLYYYGELDVKEISTFLNKPEGTIKTWLKRGREQLKYHLVENKYQNYISISKVSLYLSLLYLINYGK